MPSGAPAKSRILDVRMMAALDKAGNFLFSTMGDI
jgi:hypothetical protein